MLFHVCSGIKYTCSTHKWHTHTHPLNGPLSGTTQVRQYRKGKTKLDFTEARDSEWQWHLLGHMQVCTSLQADNHTSTPPLFLQAGCPPAAQPTVSKHWRHVAHTCKKDTKCYNLHNVVYLISALDILCVGCQVWTYEADCGVQETKPDCNSTLVALQVKVSKINPK